MKENKYIYYWVIQFNCGYGWDDCCTYDKKEYNYSDVMRDLIEYRKSGSGGAYRIIERRELNENCSYNKTVRVDVD